MRGAANYTLIIGIIVIILVALGGVYLLNSNKTTNSSATYSKGSSTTSADAQTDGEMKNLDTDLSNIDKGLNDTQGDLSEW